MYSRTAISKRPVKVKKIARPTYPSFRHHEELNLQSTLDPDNDDVEGSSFGDSSPAFSPKAVDGGASRTYITLYFMMTVLILVGKAAIDRLTKSFSSLAVFVDAAQDFLGIVTLSRLTPSLSQNDPNSYPVGRRRLVPICILVFSVIVITSFHQIIYECLQHTVSGSEACIPLGKPELAIFGVLILIRATFWLWCGTHVDRSIQILTQGTLQDIVLLSVSILLPAVGIHINAQWLDACDGIILSIYFIALGLQDALEQARRLIGRTASAEEYSMLLYVSLRFVKTIKHITGLRAIQTGDKFNVELSIVVDEKLSGRDSRDLVHGLRYALEALSIVDRAFVTPEYSGKTRIDSVEVDAEDQLPLGPHATRYL